MPEMRQTLLQKHGKRLVKRLARLGIGVVRGRPVRHLQQAAPGSGTNHHAGWLVEGRLAHRARHRKPLHECASLLSCILLCACLRPGEVGRAPGPSVRQMEGEYPRRHFELRELLGPG